MPRTKRALAEVDGNIPSAPKSKRTFNGKAASKGSSVPAKKVVQESGVDETVTEQKNATNHARGEASILDDTADTLAETIARLNKAPDGDEAQREMMGDVDDSTWMCFCRNSADKQRQHPELWLSQIEAHPGGFRKCMCGRYADRNPEHRWIITLKGAKVLGDAVQQVACRDQDYIGVYMFNKWSAYAISEVIENMVRAFHARRGYDIDREGQLAAFNKALKTPWDYMNIWSHTEALGRFLHTDYMDPYHGNYQEENAKRLMLIGTALLSAIDVLISHNLFHSNANTVIRNIGLILCHYIQFAQEWTERCRANEAGWTKVAISKAQKHGVRIEGFYGVEKVLDKALNASDAGNSTSASDVGRGPKGDRLNMIHAYESTPPLCGEITLESLRAHQEGGTRRDWSRYDLKKEISAYRRHVMVKVGLFGPEDYNGSSIGGNFYDLTAPRNTALVRQRRREARERERDHPDGESD